MKEKKPRQKRSRFRTKNIALNCKMCIDSRKYTAFHTTPSLSEEPITRCENASTLLFFFSLNIPFSILLHRQFLHFVSLFAHISMLYLVFAYMVVICVNIPGPRPFIGKITASTLINCIRNHRNDFGHFGKAKTNKQKNNTKCG